LRQAVQQLNRIKQVAPDNILAPLQLAQMMLYVQAYTNSLTQFLPSSQGYNISLSNSEEVLKILPAEPKASPERVSALFLKSVALMQLKDYDQALEPLNRLLSLQTNYAALLNRAIAFYKLDNLDAAKRDYQAVGQVVTNAYQVFYGLGEIAYKEKNTPAAIKNYELYLTNAPPGTEEAKVVYGRLKELKSAP
jgi:tetratricopeptide (TPR) repeat protein